MTEDALPLHLRRARALALDFTLTGDELLLPTTVALVSGGLERAARATVYVRDRTTEHTWRVWMFGFAQDLELGPAEDDLELSRRVQIVAGAFNISAFAVESVYGSLLGIFNDFDASYPKEGPP